MAINVASNLVKSPLCVFYGLKTNCDDVGKIKNDVTNQFHLLKKRTVKFSSL